MVPYMRPFTQSIGQAGAASGAAAGKNLAAVCGLHALTETVFLGALQLLGLIRAFGCHVVFLL